MITWPDTFYVAYDHDVTGAVTAIRANGATSGAGVLSTYGYSDLGQLTGVTRGNGASSAYGYDAHAGLTSLSQNPTGTAADLTLGFGYNPAGQIATRTGAWGDESYVYDAVGNRVEVSTGAGGGANTVLAITASDSNQIDQVKDGNGTVLRDLTWRDGGDMLQQAFAGGDVQTLIYDARKRPVQLQVNGATVATYGYDYLGRRVAATEDGATTHYVFDAEGRLLAEHDGATGQVLREYVWLDDQPIALIATAGGVATTYYVHAGQIGEPLMLTDAGRAVVWDAVIDPWGQAVMQSPASVALDLRLMGQWAQGESSLHQNWMRDYDPTLGRYVQADPLGLYAGQNLYVYVDGDPLNAVDPTGEIAFLVPILAGAAVGAGSDLALQLLMNGGNLNCVNLKSIGTSALLGGIGGGVGGKAAQVGLRALPIRTRGAIGENLSLVSNRLRGSRLVSRNRRTISHHSTRPDGTWTGPFGRTYYTESKFGISRLTPPQQRALQDISIRYNVERWSYSFFQNSAGAGGGLVGGASSRMMSRSCGCR